MRRAGRILLALAWLLMLWAAPGAWAADTLYVHPEDGPYFLPSEAVNVALAGDTVLIAEGEYADCIVVRASLVTVRGEGAGATLRDVTCQEKAIVVTVGRGITLENLTLQGARVPARNGAGIRAEGRDLTIRDLRFIDNEGGILAIDNTNSTISVADSVFERNGTCRGSGCAHGIYVNKIGTLTVTNSRFFEQYAGHQIKSRARHTEVIGNTIEDGPDGTSSYAVEIIGETSEIRDNVIEKGRGSENAKAAIYIHGGDPDAAPAHQIVDNRFTNRMSRTTAFVRNAGSASLVLRGNRLSGDVRPVEGPAEKR